jgi:transposase-like protein
MNKSPRLTSDQWREIITAQPTSGFSIAAFCRQRGISQPSFFVWRRRLTRSAEAEPSAEPFVELKTGKLAVERVAAIELRLRRGRRLLLRKGFDRDLLAEVVQALEAIA